MKAIQAFVWNKKLMIKKKSKDFFTDLNLIYTPYVYFMWTVRILGPRILGNLNLSDFQHHLH